MLLFRRAARGALSRQSLRWRSSPRLVSYPSRHLSSDNKIDEDKERGITSSTMINLRGIGQVIFLNSAKSGLVILGGLGVGDPYLAALAAVGTVTATTASNYSGIDKGALQNGLWSYNGCLVGCATAVFISPLPESLEYPLLSGTVLSGLTVTVAGAAVSPFVAVALKPALGSMPQWTFAFNIITLTMLLRLRPFSDVSEGGPPSPVNMLPSDQLIGLAANAPLKGLSQIFVVESSLTGAAVLGGIGMYSPGLAAHALLGSSIGSFTAIVLGADASDIGMGLWGFNSALTSLGVGVFFVNTPQAMALSAGGAATTAALFGALKVVFGGIGAPCLTLPFCFTMSGLYMMKDAIPGLTLARNPHSPEKNEP
eukprot:CAMPEP_0195294050 /NCGR_PEP_ID=MMETSP0707-20130614/14070_1 /TAXON_ID=33640 /ORGANISM="Asterionellopsis glacialis, Strain CCMP134" /LENGTH=368 /DNA_ID=CAMNT_0040354927 /DNA_START=192 /DNA_END=1295 /DNA_ORIENTATION=+